MIKRFPRIEGTILASALTGLLAWSPLARAASLPAASTNAIAQDRDEAAALASVRKSLKKPLEKRKKAFDAALRFDSLKVAQLMVQLFSICEREADQMRYERDEKKIDLDKILRGQDPKKQITLQQGERDRWDKLQKEIKALRDRIDAHREFLHLVADRIGGFRDAKASQWLLTNVVGAKKRSLRLKLAAVAAAPGLGAELVEQLRKALVKQKRDGDILVVLDGVEQNASKARALGAQLVPLLKHKTAFVRMRAAQVCAKVRVAAAVEPMIELLGKEKGQLRRKISLALEDFTGKPLGLSITSWRGWFAREGKDWVAKGAPEQVAGGSRMFETKKDKADGARYYMGIPQDGEGIVYVIDSSGSMKQPVKWRKLRGSGGGYTVAGPTKGQDPKKSTRLEACKTELIDALSRLERSKRFCIVWYSDTATAWRPQLQKATPSNVAEAIEWVRALNPLGSTNIHDAMGMAFDLDKPGGLKKRLRRTGAITGDRIKGRGVDTIFLLTDGAPTTPDGKFDDPEKVLRAVREWNPLKHVTVHTIGIGRGLNKQFLSALASQNGGSFKHYDDTGRQR